MQATVAQSSSVTALRQQQRCSGRSAASRTVLVRAAAHRVQPGPDAGRRAALLGGIGLGLGLGLSAVAPELASAGPASAVPVGNFLPAAPGLPGFCLYTPDDKRTPAIRAGVIRADPNFYRFAMPESWNELQLLNIQTGNFCMPKCEEPWYEAKFENPKEGSAQVIVTELQKLGAKPTSKLQDLGKPEQVVSRIGNYITGTNLEEEDVVSAEKRTLGDGREYYVYEVYAPYSKSGGHNLAAFTTKGGLAYLFVLTANDKQWASSQKTLRTMLDSFQA